MSPSSEPCMIRFVRTRLSARPLSLHRHHARPIALLAGLAMAVSLCGCGDNTAKTANQAAAQADLKAAGQNLKAAAVDTGAALKVAAKAAEPEARKLGVEAKQGFANPQRRGGPSIRRDRRPTPPPTTPPTRRATPPTIANSALNGMISDWAGALRMAMGRR